MFFCIFCCFPAVKMFLLRLGNFFSVLVLVKLGLLSDILVRIYYIMCVIIKVMLHSWQAPVVIDLHDICFSAKLYLPFKVSCVLCLNVLFTATFVLSCYKINSYLHFELHFNNFIVKRFRVYQQMPPIY